VLSEGGAFVLERWRGDLIGRLMPEPGRPCWIVPVAGSISLDGERFGAGEVCLADAGAKVLQADGAESLVAYPGAFALDVLIR
jgi:mannose-6-phosphate isomerase